MLKPTRVSRRGDGGGLSLARIAWDRRVRMVFAIIAALSAVSAYLFLRYSLLPGPSSMESQSIGRLLAVLFSIAGVFFLLVTILVMFLLIYSRHASPDMPESSHLKGNTPLEIVWTVIPLAIVIAVGAYGGIELHHMGEPGPLATELDVKVLAFQWGWQFEYPQYGIKDFALQLPVDRQVVFQIESRDVVHSFWVPEFGPKQDAVPGIVTELRITPTQIGNYRLHCAELCGWGHTYMEAPVSVTSAGDFDSWVQQQQQSKGK